MSLDHRWVWVATSVAALFAGGCGDDGSTDTGVGDTAADDGGSGTTGPSTSATASSGADTGASSGDGTDATSGDDTAGVEVPCGEQLTCTSPEICVPETFEPPCQGYDPKMGETCPPDTMPNQCGGAGAPCCCGTAPPPQYACVLPEGCAGEVDCTCIPCPVEKECVMVPDGFRCDPLPLP